VQKAIRRSREFRLSNSYYFDAIDHTSLPPYLPTNQDILHSRVKITGITETTFKVGELSYKLFDVGGQRSERKKWIHCFMTVTALVFLVSLSECDQMLYGAWYVLFLFLFPFTFDNLFLRSEPHARGSYPL
jgi:guanine nucleotide-binding protein G(i) subunit alpha